MKITRAIDIDIRSLTRLVPAEKRPAAAAFVAQAQDIDRDLVYPIGRSCAWRYRAISDLILAEGKPFRNEPLTASEIEVLRRLALLDLRYLRPTLCFRNAFLVARHVPHLDYVEGLALDRGRLVLHAWLDLGGKAIDVTWPVDGADVPCRDLGQMLRRVEHNLVHRRYLGIVLSTAEVARHVFGRVGYGSVMDCGACDHELLRRGLGPWTATGDSDDRVRPCDEAGMGGGDESERE